MDPVAGAVTGSTEAGRIHQGFQQQRTTPISGFPVAPSDRAISGYPLCLPLWPFPAARTRWPHIRRARAPNTAWILLAAAVPSRPTSATREAATLLQPRGAPSVAGIRDSSTSRLAVATAATRRRYA